MLQVAYKNGKDVSSAVAILQNKIGPFDIASYSSLIGATLPFGKNSSITSLIIGGVEPNENVHHEYVPPYKEFDFDHVKYPVVPLLLYKDSFCHYVLNTLEPEHIKPEPESPIAPAVFLVADGLPKPAFMTLNATTGFYERTPYFFSSQEQLVANNTKREKKLNALLNRLYGVL